MPHFINYNGKIFHEDMPLVGSGNRGLRYGDGFFETMKMVDGEISLEAFHFERFFASLQLMKFIIPAHFTIDFLKEQIRLLCLKNNLRKAARIRLNIFRKNGGLYDPVDHSPDFIIEAWELAENYFHLNTNGLVVDIYKEARKSCDGFSSIKSNNYLVYSMGAMFAKENKLNDCLILNNHERICDASIANVFWLQNKTICTPPISEGCIAGVMRRHLLQLLPQHGYSVQEKPLEIADLLVAEELFLTNAISGIRWVKELRDRNYTNTTITEIYSILP